MGETSSAQPLAIGNGAAPIPQAEITMSIRTATIPVLTALTILAILSGCGADADDAASGDTGGMAAGGTGGVTADGGAGGSEPCKQVVPAVGGAAQSWGSPNPEHPPYVSDVYTHAQILCA